MGVQLIKCYGYKINKKININYRASCFEMSDEILCDDSLIIVYCYLRLQLFILDLVGGVAEFSCQSSK